MEKYKFCKKLNTESLQMLFRFRYYGLISIHTPRTGVLLRKTSIIQTLTVRYDHAEKKVF